MNPLRELIASTPLAPLLEARRLVRQPRFQAEIEALAAKLGHIVRNESALAGLPEPTLAVEPGRAIAGPGTVTLYEVGTIKDVTVGSSLTRRYISVDGGMSDNIRTALYDAEYTVRLVSRMSESAPVLARVVGKHCESGDIVVRDCWLPAARAQGASAAERLASDTIRKVAAAAAIYREGGGGAGNTKRWIPSLQ